MGGIGAVSPLRRFAPALPEGEPRAWWVSMDGGRAKGAVGVDGSAGVIVMSAESAAKPLDNDLNR